MKNFYNVEDGIGVGIDDVEEIFSVTLKLNKYDKEGNLIKEGIEIERRVGFPETLEDWYDLNPRAFEVVAESIMTHALRKFLKRKLRLVK